jgi:hypothetical protein
MPLYQRAVGGQRPPSGPIAWGFCLGTSILRCGRCRTSGLAPRSAYPPTPQGMGSILKPLRCSTFSQISYSGSSSVPLVEARIIMFHGTIDIDRENISLARSTARHVYFRGFVPRYFEHSLTCRRLRF